MEKDHAQMALDAAITSLRLYRELSAIAKRTRALNDEEIAANEKRLADAVAADFSKTDAELAAEG